MEIEIKFRQHIFTRPPPDPKSFFTMLFFLCAWGKNHVRFCFLFKHLCNYTIYISYTTHNFITL